MRRMISNIAARTANQGMLDNCHDVLGDDDFKDDASEGFDEEEVWEVNEEWLMAPFTPPLMLAVPPSSIYEGNPRKRETGQFGEEVNPGNDVLDVHCCQYNGHLVLELNRVTDCDLDR
ncbi:hypothetical protein Tco_0967082 [Tanacetum coccineum]